MPDAMAGTAKSVACDGPYAVRSESTTVPATRSPSRWWRRDSRLDSTAARPKVAVKSTSPTAARIAACRKRTGAPSTVTTRSPSVALPGSVRRRSRPSRGRWDSRGHEERQDQDRRRRHPVGHCRRLLHRSAAAASMWTAHPAAASRSAVPDRANRRSRWACPTARPRVTRVRGRLPWAGSSTFASCGRAPCHDRAVDIDGFIATHRAGWDRLTELVAMAERRRRLSADELDELVRAYERHVDAPVARQEPVRRSRVDRRPGPAGRACTCPDLRHTHGERGAAPGGSSPTSSPARCGTPEGDRLRRRQLGLDDDTGSSW